jgi:hypothetical protein
MNVYKIPDDGSKLQPKHLAINKSTLLWKVTDTHFSPEY